MDFLPSEDEMRKILHVQLLGYGLKPGYSPLTDKNASTYIYSTEGLPVRKNPSPRGMWQRAQNMFRNFRALDIFGGVLSHRRENDTVVTITTNPGEPFIAAQISVQSRFFPKWIIDTPEIYTEYGAIGGNNPEPKPADSPDCEMKIIGSFSVGDHFQAHTTLADYLVQPPSTASGRLAAVNMTALQQ